MVTVEVAVALANVKVRVTSSCGGPRFGSVGQALCAHSCPIIHCFGEPGARHMSLKHR